MLAAVLCAVGVAAWDVDVGLAPVDDAAEAWVELPEDEDDDDVLEPLADELVDGLVDVEDVVDDWAGVVPLAVEFLSPALLHVQEDSIELRPAVEASASAFAAVRVTVYAVPSWTVT